MKLIRFLLFIIILMLGYIIYQVENIPKQKSDKELMKDEIRKMFDFN